MQSQDIVQHALVWLQLSQTLPECPVPPGEGGHNLLTYLPGVQPLQSALHPGQEIEHHLAAGVRLGGEPGHPVVDIAVTGGPGTPGQR